MLDRELPGNQPSGSIPQEGEYEETGLLDFLITLVKHKRIVLGIPFVAGVISAIVALALPNVYTATTRIMPPQTDHSALAFGALANVTGGAGALLGPALGLKNPSDLYVGILRGHTIADHMIDRFDLRKRYQTDTLIQTRAQLADVTVIRTGRDGLIVIEVDDEDPQVAAQMANAYVEELDKLSQGLAVTDAAQRRLFFERELVEVRDRLAASESALRATQEKTGLIQPEGQARAIFDAFADLRARITAKEVEIASMKTFATGTNPEYLRARQELISLRAQLDRLETAEPGHRNQGNILVPTTKVPEAGLEYFRRMREVKYYETLFELLARHYEIAKIDEARDAALIQTIDRAIPPDRKSKPQRTLILAATVLVTGVIAVLLAVFMETIQRARLRPEGAQRLELLREHLHF